MSARVTMATLAQRLGVSVSTVSNAFNRPEKLSPQLRAGILRLADDLGYAGPDPLARSLRRRSTGGVGVVFTDEMSFAFTDPASAGFLAGVAESLMEADRHLVLIPAGSPDHHRTAPIDRAAVDGIILHSVPIAEPTLALLRRRGTAAVVVDQPDPIDGLGWVGLDEESDMRRVGAYLVEQGHRRVGCITSRLGTTPYDGPAESRRVEHSRFSIPRHRIRGLEQGLRSSVIIEERWNVTRIDGFAAAKALLRRDPALTAIVCIADVYALGVLDWTRSRYIDVPRHLSVVGHDDIPEAASAGLTTTRQPFREKGQASAQLLLEVIADPAAASQRLTLPTTLVRRSTSGPALL